MNKVKDKSLILTVSVGLLIVFVIALPTIIIKEAIINYPIFNMADLFNYWSGVIGAVVGGIIVLLSVWQTLKHNNDLVTKQINEAQKANEAVIKDNQERFREEREFNLLPVISVDINRINSARLLINDEKKDYNEIKEDEIACATVKRIVVTITADKNCI